MAIRTELIRAMIIIIAVVIIIFAIGFLFYQNIYQQGIFKTIPKDVEQTVNNNFNILINNFNTCANNNANDCYCKIFPNFPATLPSGARLRIKTDETSNKTTIAVLYGKQKTSMQNKTIDIVVKGMNYPLNKQVFNINNDIDFSKQWPLLIKQDLVLVSEYVYKNDSKIYLLFAPAGYNKVLDTVRQDISKEKKC